MSDQKSTPPSKDDRLQNLIDEPGERLGVELKSWLDLSAPADIAKIAKACLALRNNNGGTLIIGIEDDCTPSPNPPSDVRGTYHPDVIQQIVSKFAADPFAVDVQWRSRDGQDYPIIVVPRGIQLGVTDNPPIGRAAPGSDLLFRRAASGSDLVFGFQAKLPFDFLALRSQLGRFLQPRFSSTHQVC